MYLEEDRITGSNECRNGFCGDIYRRPVKMERLNVRKKILYIFLLIFVSGVFIAVLPGVTQAAERQGPENQPPECDPILFTDEGYWGMICYDVDNNIASASIRTDGVITNLIWDNTFAQLIVQVETNTTISWQVCNTKGACASGNYP